MSSRKEYYQVWDAQEIDDYLKNFNILILFVVDVGRKEADLDIYGNLDNDQTEQLRSLIATLFGGLQMDKQLCNKINEFAEKWYNKFVLKKKARVINCRKVKR